MNLLKRNSFFAFLLICFGTFVHTSAFDLSPAVSEKQIPYSIGIHAENDILFNTDCYYTNGLELELASQRLHLHFLDRFSLKAPAGSEKHYKLLVSQKMYTPVNTDLEEIVYDDRPYAGTLTLKYSEEVFYRKIKQTSALKLGVLGSPSGTGATQNFVHKLLDNNESGGWDNQINKDFVWNLEYSIEYLLLSGSVLDISTGSYLRVGTLNTDIAGSMQIRFGSRKYRFANSGPDLYPAAGSNRRQFYLFAGIKPRLVMYNATLNGGLINPTPSKYVMEIHELEQLVAEYTFGAAGSYRNYSILLQATHLSPEFSGGKPHRWFSISAYFNF